jgi:hypothetical protein
MITQFLPSFDPATFSTVRRRLSLPTIALFAVLVAVSLPTTGAAQPFAPRVYRASTCLGTNGASGSLVSGGPGREFGCILDLTAFVTVGAATPSGTGVVTRIQLFANAGSDAARAPADLDFYVFPTVGSSTGSMIITNRLIGIGFDIPGSPLRIGQSLDVTRDVSAEFLQSFPGLRADDVFPTFLGLTTSYYAPEVPGAGSGPLALPGYVVDFYDIKRTPFPFVRVADGPVTIVPEPSTGTLLSIGLLAAAFSASLRRLRQARVARRPVSA